MGEGGAAGGVLGGFLVYAWRRVINEGGLLGWDHVDMEMCLTDNAWLCLNFKES